MMPSWVSTLKNTPFWHNYKKIFLSLQTEFQSIHRSMPSDSLHNALSIMIKNYFTAIALLFAVTSLTAQNSYFVHTKNAIVNEADEQASGHEEEEQKDPIKEYFKNYSLCDWVEGMRFMVIPEKYDLIVNTFRSAENNKEVSNGSLRHKIMVYKGNSIGDNGHSRINFHCEDNNKDYYYELTGSSFESYCGGKMGVPTLAYLGDVDTARVRLKDAVWHTKLSTYYIDTSVNSDGREEVKVKKGEEVKVVAIGVGTRRYPVKFIVEDKKGNQFFMDVAISRTNSGMRDDEFEAADVIPHTLRGAFDFEDLFLSSNSEYKKYLKQQVYTKYKTKMLNSKGEEVSVVKFSRFIVTNIKQSEKSNYVEFGLQSVKTQETYTKLVTFSHQDVIGNIDGNDEAYVKDLFGVGDIWKNIPESHRDLISKGKVAKGFTRNEVELSLGKPDRTAVNSQGIETWTYNSSMKIIQFNKAGKVIGERRI